MSMAALRGTAYTAQAGMGSVGYHTQRTGSKQRATWDATMQIRLHSVASGGCVATLEGHSDAVLCVHFSADGFHVATGAPESCAAVGCCRMLHAAYCASHVVCMAAGSHDCSVRLWERGTARCLHEFHGHTEAVCAASTQLLSNALRANTVQLSCRSREHTADNSLALHRPLRSPTRADRHPSASATRHAPVRAALRASCVLFSGYSAGTACASAQTRPRWPRDRTIAP